MAPKVANKQYFVLRPKRKACPDPFVRHVSEYTIAIGETSPYRYQSSEASGKVFAQTIPQVLKNEVSNLMIIWGDRERVVMISYQLSGGSGADSPVYEYAPTKHVVCFQSLGIANETFSRIALLAFDKLTF